MTNVIVAAACTTPLLCAIQEVANAVRGDPLPVFWLTLAATFLGAVVGAAVAYFGTLDLNRRQKEDRQQEREQDRLDRQAERADERDHQRAAWESELAARRDEREEQRAYEYGLQMRRLWEDMLVRLTKDGSLGGPQYEAENRREIVATLMAIDVSARDADAEFRAAFKPRLGEWSAHQRSEDRQRLTAILYGWLNGALDHADAVSSLAVDSEWDDWPVGNDPS